MPLTFRDYLKKDGWIPLHSFHGHQEIADRFKDIDSHKSPQDGEYDFKDSVKKLRKLIEKDPDLYQGFTDMFKEAGPNSLVPDYEKMLELIDNVIRQPPIYRDYYGGAPGLSFNNILGAVILTRSGSTTFCNDELNKVLQEILADWCKYLSGPDSVTDSLTCKKWLSIESITNLSKYLKGFDPHEPYKAFKKAFVVNDMLPYWGFLSWNDFFARPFVSPEIFDHFRPMPKPEIPDNVITSAADSRVYGIATNVSEMDTFWLKGHKYSLKHLFDNISDPDKVDEPLHKKYIGGTVYQAYLLPSDYHQWSMPISGTVKKIVTVPGTYFALSNALVDPANPDEFAGLVEGLPYLTIVSTRKIAIIKADNPKLGTVCIIPVGLQEISSVKFFHNLENEEKHLKKGEALGTFQYGGSTVCMVFEPGVNIKWDVSQLEHVLIRAKIAEIY